jgi:hypothetical protein
MWFVCAKHAFVFASITNGGAQHAASHGSHCLYRQRSIAWVLRFMCVITILELINRYCSLSLLTRFHGNISAYDHIFLIYDTRVTWQRILIGYVNLALPDRDLIGFSGALICEWFVIMLMILLTRRCVCVMRSICVTVGIAGICFVCLLMRLEALHRMQLNCLCGICIAMHFLLSWLRGLLTPFYLRMDSCGTTHCSHWRMRFHHRRAILVMVFYMRTKSTSILTARLLWHSMSVRFTMWLFVGICSSWKSLHRTMCSFERLPYTLLSWSVYILTIGPTG